MNKLRGLAAAFLAGAMMLSVAGCSGVKYIEDEDKFFDALEKTADIRKKDTILHEKNTIFDGDDVEYIIFAEDGDNYYLYVRYEDEDDAMDRFEEFFEDFEDALDDDVFDGANMRALSKTKGSVVLNGDFEDGVELSGFDKFYDDTGFYGGVYVNKNVYIEVYSLDGSKRDKEKIDTFLKTIGMPKP